MVSSSQISTKITSNVLARSIITSQIKITFRLTYQVSLNSFLGMQKRSREICIGRADNTYLPADTLVSLIRNLNASFEQPERIHCRHSCADQYNYDKRGKCSVIAHHTAEKARNDQEKSAQYKRLSAQPMCPVPVFRAV